MPQSLDIVPVHIVFSTHERRPYLKPDIAPRMHAFLARVARELGCECPRVGGVADHVHIVLSLGRTLSIARVVGRLKSTSSAWIKTLGPEWSGFAWQRGYAAFGVSVDRMPAVIGYIERQPIHHAERSFQSELVGLLEAALIKYDE